MFSQPNAEVMTTSWNEQGQPIETWGPVPQGLWDYFSTQEQAEKLLKENVLPVVKNATLMDGLNLDLFIPVRYLDETTKIWVVKGTWATNLTLNSTTTCAIDEYAGSLCDRQIKPNPFVDGTGGPNLIPVPITVDGQFTGLAQLKWGK